MVAHTVAKQNVVDASIDKVIHCDILQPKEDGWYAEGVQVEDLLYLFSASSTQLVTFPIPKEVALPGALRGEYMFGTHRAKKSHKYLKYIVYDVMLNQVYAHRFVWLKTWVQYYTSWCKQRDMEPMILLIDDLRADSFNYLVDEVIAGRTEGVIGRSFDDTGTSKIYRFKPRFTRDYVCMGMTQGTGKYENATGALIGGQWLDGKLVDVCHCSGMNDKLREHSWLHPEAYVGRVFEVEGQQAYDSGAMQHPRFKRWREDVASKDVLFGKAARYVR